MGEDQDIAGRGTDLVEHAVAAGGNVVELLAFGNTVAPEAPAGKLLSNLDGLAPLVGAVVPLHELVPLRCSLSEPRQAAGLGGAHERARENDLEPTASQLSSQSERPLAPALGQRDVGASGVLPAPAPLRLRMPDENDLGRSARHRRQG